MYIFVGQVNIKMIGRLFFFPLGPASIEGSPARGNREKLGQFCALLYPASSFKGEHGLIFFTPELLLERRWRDVLHSKPYDQRVRAFVVDEAHTVKKW